MRQSELEAKLSSLADTLLTGARQVVLVGGGLSLPGRTLTRLAGPAEALARGERFDAALWSLSADTSSVRADLGLLRGALLPGAAVLLVARQRAPALEQLRSMLSGESTPRARLEPLCNALLLSGFLAPRVHPELSGHLVVSATLARSVDALDDFFAQPAGASYR